MTKTRRLSLGLLALLLTGLPACDGPSEQDLPRGRAARAERSAREGGKKTLREITLRGAPLEGDERPLFGKREATLREVLAELRSAVDDTSTTGLLLRLGPMAGSFARVKDLEGAIGEVRRKGKPVHCYAEGLDNVGYALAATSCDRITLTPAGDIDLVGVAAQLFYARAFLESLGLRAELVQAGRFKGAADPFTRDDMPPEVRESLGAMLDALSLELVRAVSRGRKIDEARVRALIDGGPYDADGAKAAGLIDAVAFDDEARAHAKKAARAEEVDRVVLPSPDEAPSLADLIAALGSSGGSARESGPRIGLLHAVGNILDGEGHDPGSVHADPFVDAARRFADDAEIKAVVLRIDSPGGSALASDRMWHALRRIAARKPLLVSIGDMAASGGYYIASASSTIYAQPTSIVGSIGVVGGKITAAALAGRIGVHTEILSRGAHAGWTSPLRPFSDEERALLERMIHRTYDRFVSRIRAGRGLTDAEISTVAEGRLMTATRAKEAKLVDHFGGLEDALTAARRGAGLDADAPVEAWPAQRTFVDALAEALGARSPEAQVLSLFSGTFEALVPGLELGALEPFITGRERTLVALPFGLRLR